MRSFVLVIRVQENFKARQYTIALHRCAKDYALSYGMSTWLELILYLQGFSMVGEIDSGS